MILQNVCWQNGKKLLTEVYDEYTVCRKKLEEASLDAKQQARELLFYSMKLMKLIRQI